MLEHGGRLRAAAQTYGIPLDQWIDLSTGISPWLYPIPAIPNDAWHRLPEPDDGLDTIAAHYYGNNRLLATAGSQPAIQQLPTLFEHCRVAIIGPTYNEHVAAWRLAGHDLHLVDALNAALEIQPTVVVLCNPNNPTATHHQPDQLLAAAEQLNQRKAWLIVDEAYGDAYPELSITNLAGTPVAPRLITLRSLGKFFGLAGARVGFIFGDSTLLNQLADKLGPWTINGPARFVAQKVLADTTWQTNHIAHIRDAGLRLKQLITRTVAPLEPVKSTGLFSTFTTPDAEAIFEHLARHGILVRLFRQESLIRIGIAADYEWKRLENVLQAWHTTT